MCMSYAFYRMLGWAVGLSNAESRRHSLGWTLDKPHISTRVLVHRVRWRRRRDRHCLARRADFIGIADAHLDFREIVNEARWSLYTVDDDGLFMFVLCEHPLERYVMTRTPSLAGSQFAHATHYCLIDLMAVAEYMPHLIPPPMCRLAHASTRAGNVIEREYCSIDDVTTSVFGHADALVQCARLLYDDTTVARLLYLVIAMYCKEASMSERYVFVTDEYHDAVLRPLLAKACPHVYFVA